MSAAWKKTFSAGNCAAVSSKSRCPVSFTHDLSGFSFSARRSSSAGRRRFAGFGFQNKTRRRSGGKVGIPGFVDFQGTVGAVGNLVLVFHRFHGPVFSTALRL